MRLSTSGCRWSYDLIHDDAWFGRQPTYFDRAVELLDRRRTEHAKLVLARDALTGTRYRHGRHLQARTGLRTRWHTPSSWRATRGCT